MQIMRQAVRNDGRLGERLILAFYQLIARFPEAWGEGKFMLDRLMGRQAMLME